MANREITYYSLLSSENLRHIEQMADTMDEQSFVTLGFEQKWFHHLWIGANNEAFLEHISHQTDLAKLDMILGEQLKLYARKQGEGYEDDKGDFYGTYKARKDWLNHTIFICRNEYNKTRNEVFNEVVKWCIDWQNKWLETFNPYSPNECKEMSKTLKTPLWESLNEDKHSFEINEKYPKIKALFQFIEYLHSNIENFNQYNGLIKELEELKDQKDELKPEYNYKEKLQYDKLQAELESRFKVLQENTANPIKAKAIELNVCDPNRTETLWNWNIDEIQQLKNNFNHKDLPEIFKNKSKYLEYRSQTHGTFLSLEFFFDRLDKIAKSLFDYFKNTEINEFEGFETKAIQVNSFAEAIKGLKQGQTKFFISTSTNGQTQKEVLASEQSEQQNTINYKADEYALAYIFDLYAIGKQVPINRIEGTCDAKKIKKDSALFSSFTKKPDTFYRAVKKVLKYDLNKIKELQQISKDWFNAIKKISNNWKETATYLRQKGLCEE